MGFVKSEREASVSSPWLSSAFLVSNQVRVSSQVNVMEGIWLQVGILRALYRHSIQSHAGALHKQTLLSHVSKIVPHTGWQCCLLTLMFERKRGEHLIGRQDKWKAAAADLNQCQCHIYWQVLFSGDHDMAWFYGQECVLLSFCRTNFTATACGLISVPFDLLTLFYYCCLTRIGLKLNLSQHAFCSLFGFPEGLSCIVPRCL